MLRVCFRVLQRPSCARYGPMCPRVHTYVMPWQLLNSVHPHLYVFLLVTYRLSVFSLGYAEFGIWVPLWSPQEVRCQRLTEANVRSAQDHWTSRWSFSVQLRTIRNSVVVDVVDHRAPQWFRCVYRGAIGAFWFATHWGWSILPRTPIHIPSLCNFGFHSSFQYAFIIVRTRAD